MNKRDIEFLYEIGTLKNIERSWNQTLGVSTASVLEHTVRVMCLALIIAKKEGADTDKVLRMALVHDLSETRTADGNYIHKVYVKTDDEKAAQHLFAETSLEYLRLDALEEYEQRQSLEAKIVKDADNLDVDLEMKELEERGSKLVEKWKGFRKKVRDDKLYTDSAKELWDLIQTVDVSSWHLAANKWVHMPKAGK